GRRVPHGRDEEDSLVEAVLERDGSLPDSLAVSPRTDEPGAVVVAERPREHLARARAAAVREDEQGRLRGEDRFALRVADLGALVALEGLADRLPRAEEGRRDGHARRHRAARVVAEIEDESAHSLPL